MFACYYGSQTRVWSVSLPTPEPAEKTLVRGGGGAPVHNLGPDDNISIGLIVIMIIIMIVVVMIIVSIIIIIIVIIRSNSSNGNWVPLLV